MVNQNLTARLSNNFLIPNSIIPIGLSLFMGMKIQALFISDVHLGSKGSNAEYVLEILKQYEPEYLFLVGDIIDGWLLKRKFRWPQSHTNVISCLLYTSPSPRD